MKKKKFNILDIAIILALVFFVAGSIIKAATNGSDVFSAKNKKVTLYVLADDDSKALSKVLSKGEAVRISDTDALIGTIDGVVIKNNKQYVRNGSYFEAVYTKDKQDVVIRITCDIMENENGRFAADNTFIAAGTTLNLETDNAVFKGEVTKITDIR